MAGGTDILNHLSRKLNVGISTVIEFLGSKGYTVENNPNAKIDDEQYALLSREFADSAHDKEEASGLTIGNKPEDVVIKKAETHKEYEERILIKDNVEHAEPKKEVERVSARTVLEGPKVIGKIDLDGPKKKPEPVPAPVEVKKEAAAEPVKEEPKVTPPVSEPEKQAPPILIKAEADTLKGLTVLGKIELPKERDKSKPVASSDQNQDRKKRPRKRIAPASSDVGRQDRPRTGGPGGGSAGSGGGLAARRKTEELSDKEIQDKIKATLAKLSGGKQTTQLSKYRKDKRSAKAEAEEERVLQEAEQAKTLKVT